MVKGFYKININEKVLQLIDTKDIPFIILQNAKQELIADAKDSSIILQSIKKLEKGSMERIIIHANNVELLFEKVQKLYTVIHAAGGVVVNSKNEILSIYRRKFWDFPKGKIEIGEKKKDAAIREVKEECGIKKIELGKKLGITYHQFGTIEKRKLKVSHWYIMHSDDTKLVPQTSEDIEKVKWFSPSEFLLKAKPIYSNIVDVYEAYLLKYK